MGSGHTTHHTADASRRHARRISDRFSVLLGAPVVLYVPKWPDCNRREKGAKKIVREMKREGFVPISEKMPTLEREFNACPCVMFMFLVDNRKKTCEIGRNLTLEPGPTSMGMGRSRFGFEGAYLFHSYQFGQMRLTPRRVPSTRTDTQPAHCLLYL